MIPIDLFFQCTEEQMLRDDIDDTSPIEFELFSFVHKVHYSVANFEENNCFFSVDHELINLRMNTVYAKVNYVNPCRAFIFDLESS